MDHNSIVNVKEMSNDLLRIRSFYANLNEIDLSSRGNLRIMPNTPCHRVALLTPEVLSRAGLSPAAKVLDLGCQWSLFVLVGVVRSELGAYGV